MSDFKLSEDLTKTQELSEVQVTAIQDVVTTHYKEHKDANGIADLKKEWDSKANDDAEAILNGAATKITDLTKVSRDQGEKIADFIGRATDTHFTSTKQLLEDSKTEYEEKVKNFKGDPDLVKNFGEVQTKYDALQKKEADYDAMLKSGIKDKYDKLIVEHATNLQAVAFGSVKPTFHKDANQFEVSAKWNDFIKKVEEKHNIVMVDNEAKAVDKENEHKVVSLKDLVDADETLKELMKGRTQDPLNAKETDFKEVEGVPFKVPVNADGATITKLIYEQLATEGLEKFGDGADKWTKRFAELNRKARAT